MRSEPNEICIENGVASDPVYFVVNEQKVTPTCQGRRNMNVQYVTLPSISLLFVQRDHCSFSSRLLNAQIPIILKSQPSCKTLLESRVWM
jgi:hypothetical protein